MNDFLIRLKSEPEFQELLRTIMTQRPVVPEHNLNKDNTEIWKARSAEKRGFDIWLTYLRIEEKS